MALTMVEKILARAAGRSAVAPGDTVEAKPDFVLAYDWPGQTDFIFREMKERFGVSRVSDPSRFAVFIDHFTASPTEKEELFHQGTRDWCAENGVPAIEGLGIGHRVAGELGYAPPGAFVVHFDGHISQLGSFGALAIGLRRALIEAFVRDYVTITVPATVRIDFKGKLADRVMGRDVFHNLISLMGPDSAAMKVLEIGGEGAGGLSSDDLEIMTGLAMFLGAVSAIVEPSAERLEAGMRVARKTLPAVFPDSDARYAQRFEVDLGSVAPMIVAPPNPSKVAAVADYQSIPVQVGYIGSCASGRIDELRAAATILRDKKISPDFALHVVPTSKAIMDAASEEGLLDILSEAGARIWSPTCDLCYGRIALTREGQSAISTGTLNVTGRMGNIQSDIYLASAATVAASAVVGRIADPRSLD